MLYDDFTLCVGRTWKIWRNKEITKYMLVRRTMTNSLLSGGLHSGGMYPRKAIALSIHANAPFYPPKAQEFSAVPLSDFRLAHLSCHYRICTLTEGRDFIYGHSECCLDLVFVFMLCLLLRCRSFMN